MVTKVKKAGAPAGNQNAKNGKQARQALELALSNYGKENKEVSSKIKTLVDIWDKQIKQAIEGDNHSACTIFDRLDGKPGQTVDLGPDTTVHFHLDYLGER
jgi:ADP-dependent phosphofructokinase/glucokinase